MAQADRVLQTRAPLCVIHFGVLEIATVRNSAAAAAAASSSRLRPQRRCPAPRFSEARLKALLGVTVWEGDDLQASPRDLQITNWDLSVR